jgi:hypothetical protein
MIKRVPCRVVSSSFSGQHHASSSSQPPMMPGDPSGSLGEVNADGERECFPMGMFVDVIIGDR